MLKITLFFLFCFLSVPLSCTDTNVPAQLSLKELVKKERTKQYKALCKAVEADDLVQARELLQKNPNLKTFSHTNEGTPLHFVRSLAMAKLLVNEFGFNPWSCDEFGKTALFSIMYAKKSWFINEQEGSRIVTFLWPKEESHTFNKLWNQLKANKELQIKLCLSGMAGFFITKWTYIFSLYTKVT